MTANVEETATMTVLFVTRISSEYDTVKEESIYSSFNRTEQDNKLLFLSVSLGFSGQQDPELPSTNLQDVDPLVGRTCSYQ
jgi:hypothetical protein